MTTEMDGVGRYVTCEAMVRFRVVAWSDLAARQLVYYRLAADGYAHGPFRVVDPGDSRLENAGGVGFRLTSARATLLVPAIGGDRR